MKEIKFRVWDGELMQFTGLHDKNGKEIYEGDIVKNSFRRGYERFVVKFGFYDNDLDWEDNVAGYGFYLERVFRYYQSTNSYSEDELYQIYTFLYPNIKQCEVIGNIYENRELLKKDGVK
jgi:uncharacterized phage protein (TIGR01671 family)